MVNKQATEFMNPRNPWQPPCWPSGLWQRFWRAPPWFPSPVVSWGKKSSRGWFVIMSYGHWGDKCNMKSYNLEHRNIWLCLKHLCSMIVRRNLENRDWRIAFRPLNSLVVLFFKGRQPWQPGVFQIFLGLHLHLSLQHLSIVPDRRCTSGKVGNHKTLI